MRLHASRLIGAALVLAGLAMHSPATAAADDAVTVTPNRAKVVQIPPKTQTLIIGAPGIADVTLLRNTGEGVITGKNFGETNMIALDSEGNMLVERIVRVEGVKADLLVQSGANREWYTCSPLCLPTMNVVANAASSLAAGK